MERCKGRYDAVNGVMNAEREDWRIGMSSISEGWWILHKAALGCCPATRTQGRWKVWILWMPEQSRRKRKKSKSNPLTLPQWSSHNDETLDHPGALPPTVCRWWQRSRTDHTWARGACDVHVLPGEIVGIIQILERIHTAQGVVDDTSILRRKVKLWVTLRSDMPLTILTFRHSTVPGTLRAYI